MAGDTDEGERGDTPAPLRQRVGRFLSARRRVLLGLSVLYGPAMVLVNVAGSALVLAFLVFFMPVPEGVSVSDDVLQGNLVRFGVYLAVALPVGYGGTMWRYRRVFAWLASDREPTEAERRLALRLPLFQTRLVIVLWLIGVALFVPPMVAVNRELGRQVATVGLIGAVGTAGGSYLVAEQFLRGLARQALAGAGRDRRLGPGITARILVAWLLGTGLPLGAIAGLTLATDDPSNLPGPVLFLGFLGLSVGLGAVTLALRTVKDPIRDIARAVERIGDGDLDVAVDVYDGSEIGVLQAGVNEMAAGLRERDRLADLFGRHVGTEVASLALEMGTRREGVETTATVLFVDVIGSSRLTTERPASDVLILLNRLFDVIVTTVHDHGGWVNKFVGDEAMCVWGAPVPDPDSATHALACARELIERLRHDVPEVDVGIGLAHGLVVAGNLGSEHRFEFTVLGDAVIEAARLTEDAKRDPARVLASWATVAAAPSEERHWTRGEDRVLRSRRTPTRLARPRRGSSGATTRSRPDEQISRS